MSTELIEQIKRARARRVKIEQARAQAQSDLHMNFAETVFYLTPALLAFVAMWEGEEVFVEDIYQLPHAVNRQQFIDLARQHYQAAMNTWQVTNHAIEDTK